MTAAKPPRESRPASAQSGRRASRLVDIADKDMRAFRREPFGGGESDTAAAAGD